MPRLFHRALALLLCLLLVQAALPTRTGVVCVERGRVVATCWMASLPKAAATPRTAPTSRMACCSPSFTKAAEARASAPCPAHQKTRCAYAYRSGATAVVDSKMALKAQSPELVAALAPPFEVPSFDALVGPRGQAFAGDSDPPRSRPRAPDRGRAPPVV